MSSDRNNFDDFFKDQNETKPSLEETGMQAEPTSSPNERPNYYAYGPYRNQLASREGETADRTSSRPSSHRSIVYNTVPSAPPKKRSSFMGYFSAFLAGVLLVGTMMWAADYNNWFTGNPPAVSGVSGNASHANGNSGNGSTDPGISKSAFDTIRPNNISQIVDQSSGAVVLVESYVKGRSSSQGGNSLFDDPWFRQFFGDDFFGNRSNNNNNNNGGALQKQGMGTGFIFDKSGYILTNQHVIDGADEIRVTVEGYDKPFVAKLLGSSYELDLACLKIEGNEDFSMLQLGNAEEMNVGDWVVAIGNPYGFDHTVTVGVLSAKGRPISIPDTKGTRKYENLFQTDASINPGNSGGPLLNMRGEVIGINTAVSSQAQGIGFAIPSSTVSKVVDNLKNNVEIPKEPVPFLGVGLSDIDKDWVSDLKLKNTEGAFITDVVRRGPAFQAGIRPYDVVVDMNGTSIKNAKELQELVKKYKVGDEVTVGVMRDGSRMEIKVIVGDRNEYEQQ